MRNTFGVIKDGKITISKNTKKVINLKTPPSFLDMEGTIKTTVKYSDALANKEVAKYISKEYYDTSNTPNVYCENDFS